MIAADFDNIEIHQKIVNNEDILNKKMGKMNADQRKIFESVIKHIGKKKKIHFIHL